MELRWPIRISFISVDGLFSLKSTEDMCGIISLDNLIKANLPALFNLAKRSSAVKLKKDPLMHGRCCAVVILTCTKMSRKSGVSS